MKNKISFFASRGFIVSLAVSVGVLPFFPTAPALAKSAENEQELSKIIEEINSGKINKSDIFTLLEQKVDLLSFLGKPVRVPVASDNPNGFPGQDVDYLYIFPPQFYQDQKTGKILSSPVSAVYSGAGRSFSKERMAFIQDGVEIVLNTSLADKQLLTLEVKKNLIAQANSAGRKKTSFWDALKKIFRSAEAKISGGAPKYSQELLQKIFASSDPRVDQSVNLLILNLIYGDVIAWAANLDKEACLLAGGGWSLDGKCDLEKKAQAEEMKAACRESGGTWGRAFSWREICRNQCGMSTELCAGELRMAPDDAFGCLCPPEQCLGADGKCVASEASLRDGDGDGISNARDKCPHSRTGELVGLEGCSCEDYQKTGVAKIERRECPKTQCEGTFYVSYPESGSDQCVNGFITEHSCSPTSRQTTPECQERAAAEAAADYTPTDETSAQKGPDKNKAMRKLTRETNGGKTFVASSSSVSWTKIFPNLRNIGTSPPWSYRLPSSSSPGGIYTPPAPGGFSSSPGGIYTPRAPGGFSSSPGGIYIPTPAQNLSLFGRLAPYAAAIAPYAAAIAPYAAGTGAMVATGLALEQLFPSEEMGPLGTGKKELYDPNNFGPSGDPGFPSEAIRAHNDWVGKRQEPGAMPPVKPGQPGQGQDVGTGQVGQPASGPTYWDTMPNADGSASLITIDFFGNQVVDGVIVKTKEKLEEEKQAMGERAKSEQKDPNNPDDTTQQGNVQDKPSKTEGQTP